MRDAVMRVDDTLSIDNENNLHINKVEVFTGDDDWNETDSIEIHTQGNELLAKQLLTRKLKPTSYRLRGEPAVRIFLDGENGKDYVLTIAHHKGNIYISTKEIEHAELV